MSTHYSPGQGDNGIPYRIWSRISSCKPIHTWREYLALRYRDILHHPHTPGERDAMNLFFQHAPCLSCPHARERCGIAFDPIKAHAFAPMSVLTRVAVVERIRSANPREHLQACSRAVAYEGEYPDRDAPHIRACLCCGGEREESAFWHGYAVCPKCYRALITAHLDNRQAASGCCATCGKSDEEVQSEWRRRAGAMAVMCDEVPAHLQPGLTLADDGSLTCPGK